MTIIELKEKITAAESKVEKIEGTIEKHKKAAEKKLAIIIKNGWDQNDRWCMKDTEDYNESYWLICEYQDKLEAIKSSEKKLKEAQKIVENWKIKLLMRNQVISTISNEMPEIFNQLKDDLANEWTNHDIKIRETMIKNKSILDYKEFRNLYNYNQERVLMKSDEDFKNINLKMAEEFIIDLYNRVKIITGEVTDWSHIRYSGKALNGFITGKDGKAEVETIIAGGYNIQKMHYRVLVKKLK